MSATIRIDASGSAPSFMDRVQAGMDKVIKSERNLNSALQRLSKSFEATSTNSEMLSNAAETLAHKFAKGALFGSAAAVGMVLANSMKEVGGRILSVGQAAETALSGLNGVATSIGEATSRAQTLTQAAADTRKALEDLSQSNVVNAFIFKRFGGDQVLGDLEESLKGLASLEVLTATKGENKNLQRLLGASPEQRPDLEKQIKREQEMAAFKSSKAFQGADSKTREKMLLEFQKNQELKKTLDEKKETEKTAKELLDFKKEIELKNADYAKSLDDAAAADERKRARELQFKREDFQRGLAEARKAADKMTEDRNAKIRSETASAASDILGIAGQSGSPYADIVEKLQKQSDVANRKKDIADIEARAMAMVADKGQIGPGLIDPRNRYGGLKSKQTIVSEFLSQQQNMKDAGRRTLDDIYQVLNDTLREITSTPRVGAN